MQKLIFILMLLCIGACKNSDDASASGDTDTSANIQFDKVKWLTKDGSLYPYRAKMLQDLMDNGQLKGMSKSQIIEKLGAPNNENKNFLFYTIEKQHLGMLPLNTKTLVLRFAPNDTVEAVLVHG